MCIRWVDPRGRQCENPVREKQSPLRLPLRQITSSPGRRYARLEEDARFHEVVVSKITEWASEAGAD